MGQPNEALALLIREADEYSGCSWAGLARRVNNLGAAEGIDLRYDYTAVNRWIKRGERPRPPVPTLIAKALSEKLGRRIDPSDFNMPDEPSLCSRALDYPAHATAAVETIIALGRADMNRRSIMKAPFVLAALATSSRDWLIASLESAASTESDIPKIGAEEVANIRKLFGIFQEMDVLRGGGHARTTLVEYMNTYVLPLLHRQHAPSVQVALYEAASEQAYLIGWMAYDDGQHGLAQRYLIQALRLAEEARCPALGAHVLAGLSDQANLLGYPQEALALARAGRRGMGQRASTVCLADLLILEARALARLGDAKQAANTVAKAERVFEKVVPADEPEWARFIDRAYFFGEAAHCFRDLAQPDQIDRFAGESLKAAYHQRRARRGALSEAAMAVADLTRGEVEAAARRSARVVELSAKVNSSRCRDTVLDLKRRLRPFADLPEVVAFHQKAADVVGPEASGARGGR